MEINFDELSYQELKDLEKKIREAKENKQHKFKFELNVSERLKDIFDEDVAELGVAEQNRNEFFWRMDRSVFSVCDLATGNFRANKKQRNNDALAVWLNTASLNCKVDADIYAQMVDEVIALMKKYHDMWSYKEDIY